MNALRPRVQVAERRVLRAPPAEARHAVTMCRIARACACAVGIASALRPTAARAATPDASKEPSPAVLVAARELFRQATEDVDAGRFDVALEKFTRVARIKETASVRFDIAKCEQALSRWGTALADFELAEREGEGDADPKVVAIATEAHEQAKAIRPHVPRLTIALPGAVPDGMRVTLDGEAIAPATLGVALPVDPGRHRVEANRDGAPAFAEEVTLADGASARVDVRIDGVKPGATAVDGARPRRTWTLVAGGAGVVLGGASVTFLALHDDAVASFKRLCAEPGGACPNAQRDQALSLHGRAVADENISLAFGAGALVAVGLGAVFLLAPSAAPRRAAVQLTPVFGARGAGIRGEF